MSLDQPHETRVDSTGPEDIELMEPEWRDDAIRGCILSYRTFGYDLFEHLQQFGFSLRGGIAEFARQAGAGVFDDFAVVGTKITTTM